MVAATTSSAEHRSPRPSRCGVFFFFAAHTPFILCFAFSLARAPLFFFFFSDFIFFEGGRLSFRANEKKHALLVCLALRKERVSLRSRHHGLHENACSASSDELAHMKAPYDERHSTPAESRSSGTRGRSPRKGRLKDAPTVCALAVHPSDLFFMSSGAHSACRKCCVIGA